MRKFLFLLILLVALSLLGIRSIRQSVRDDLAAPVRIPTSLPSPTLVTKETKEKDVTRSIFVPYWGLSNGKIKEQYDSYLYFGITPTSSSINKKEAGYANIDKFLEAVPSTSDKKLVLRMLDSDITFPILKDSARQSSLISDAISIAKKNGFDGIVLDLEISAVPFDSLIKQVNDFTNRFYTEAKNKNMKFGLMFYGDSFYRIRPFDIKTLSKNADEFLIMSYDFSKSRGNPGPNFPLHGKEIYGYDMTGMIEDFLRYLPAEKTTVVFGLFGYDWIVDDKGAALSQGEAKTYNEIQKEFLTKCDHKDCDIKRKNDSVETQIAYTDDNNKKHIVWFEDMESVKRKQDFLRKKGIGNFSLWAYSYF